MKTYLLKIRQSSILGNDFGIRVYKVVTDNIYRIIGKIYCLSLEKIKRIDYSIWTIGRETFWKEKGYDIFNYVEPILSEDN